MATSDSSPGPTPAGPGDPAGEAAPRPGADPGAVSDTVARLASEDIEAAERSRLMGRLVTQTAGRTTGGGWLPRPQAVMGAVIELLTEIAERLPLRDLETLRTHHPGLSDEELATRLIRNASRTTAAIGAAGGGIAAVEWAVPPTLLTAPVLLTAETIAVAAAELKLIGELHEIYRQPVRGTAMQRATALLTSWAQRRGVNPLTSGRGMGAVLSTAARKELRDRLLRRFGRNLTTLAPLLTGAAVGAELNRRATRSVGEEVRKDLQQRPHRVIEGAVTPPPPANGAASPGADS
ncbi:MAG: hypothetical protein ACRDT6_10240 [Micromonosporaceae bacterium]